MKYINKTLLLLTSLILFTFIISCIDNGRSKRTKEVLDNSPGTYVLDLTKSEMDSSAKKLSVFKNLTFILTDDSFKFSRKIPYEYDSVGTWETECVDAAVYIELFFRTRGKWQICPEDDYILMMYWYTIEKYPKETGRLYFVKKSK